MKLLRCFALFFVVLLAALAGAQTTPNLLLNIPTPGTLNWNLLLNSNFSLLDSYFSGVTPIPTVGGLKLANPGIFTNTQMNLYFQSAAGGCNPASEQTALNAFPGNSVPFITSPMVGCLAIPNTSVIGWANGITSYANSSSSATQVNGIVGSSRCLVNGVSCVAMIGLASDVPSLTSNLNLVGLLTSVNAANPGSAYRVVNGVVVAADFTGGAIANSNGILIDTFPSTGQQWANGMNFDNGASANGLVLRGTCLLGGGNTCPSQGILFSGVNAGIAGNSVGIIASSTGNFLINTVAGNVLQINNKTLFATLNAQTPCSSVFEGSTAPVTDSNTNTWGATVAGGGSFHILAYCDGTNYTVMAK